MTQHVFLTPQDNVTSERLNELELNESKELTSSREPIHSTRHIRLMIVIDNRRNSCTVDEHFKPLLSSNRVDKYTVLKEVIGTHSPTSQHIRTNISNSFLRTTKGRTILF
jgi:hypothetical protein